MLAGLAAVLLVSASAVQAGCHSKASRSPKHAHANLAAKQTSVASRASIDNISDPTHGLVSHVTAEDAWARNLVSITDDDTVLFSIDRTSVLSAGQNRDSVRIESKETFNPGTLFLADFKHAPVGCSAWPAYWFYGANWPSQGEIDLLEGVNDRDFNMYTLHTTDTCTRDSETPFAGNPDYSSTMCDAYGATSGCGIVDEDPASYGTGFNEAGGGVFALKFAEEGISVWRWKRSNIPADVQQGSPDPASWGTPVAAWDLSTCDITQHFKDLRMTFDITTCGDWAGNDAVWTDPAQSGSCATKYATCADAVADPNAFAEAYFEISYVKVFSL
ncbi:glycoside hydrolase family 16 protein [Rhodotorula paludigena]|uniref:glycoside hydrolase family 16 protein n=1 Tax=Rhodotorula paludigena TaxID=86838 RepID=UPI00316DACF2